MNHWRTLIHHSWSFSQRSLTRMTYALRFLMGFFIFKFMNQFLDSHCKRFHIIWFFIVTFLWVLWNCFFPKRKEKEKIAIFLSFCNLLNLMSFNHLNIYIMCLQLIHFLTIIQLHRHSFPLIFSYIYIYIFVW